MITLDIPQISKEDEENIYLNNGSEIGLINQSWFKLKGEMILVVGSF